MPRARTPRMAATVRALLIAAAGAATAGCAASAAAPAPAAHTAGDATETAGAAEPAGPGPAVGDASESIFGQPWEWTDERGQAVSFSAWRGHTVVVGMVYTSCTT